jgi:hypothetical protein
MRQKPTRNHAWLAKRLGVDRSRVSRYTTHPDWRWGDGDWTNAQVAEIKAWRRARRSLANATSTAELAAVDFDPANPEASLAALGIDQRTKLALMIERLAKLKLQREIMLGNFVDREGVESLRVEAIARTKAKLTELPMRAAQLVGMAEGDIAAALRAWAMEVVSMYAGEPLSVDMHALDLATPTTQ